MAAFTRTGVQNAVVITDRYSAEEFENKSNQLFSQLQLGRQNGGRAILYLYSPRLHSLKIEVGYALEGVMPDAKTHFYEEAAKTFTYVDRYQDFWAELINTINIDIFEQEHPGNKTATPGFDASKFRFLSGGAGTYSQAYTATPEQLRIELKKLPAYQKSEYAPSTDVHKSLAIYLRSLQNGIGENELPVLSAESRIFRQLTPLTTYQLYRNWKMYSDAGLDRVIVADDTAFAFFKAGHPVLPVVFTRSNDVWLVQEPLSWSLFQRFEDSMQVFLKFPLRTSSAELKSYLTAAFGNPLYPLPMQTLDLLGRDNDLGYFYFKFYFLERAQTELAKISGLSNNSDYLYLALDISNNLGQFSKSLEYMHDLVRLHPDDQGFKHVVEFYEKAYVFSGPQWVRKGL